MSNHATTLMHQTLNQMPVANQAKTMLYANAPVAHHLSWILRIYLMITKHPQNEISKGISTLKLAAGHSGRDSARENLWRHSSGSSEGAIFTNCSVPVHHMDIFLQFFCQTQQGIVETAYTRLCIDKIGKQTTVDKMDRSSCAGVEKDPGLHSIAWHV